MPPPRAFCKPSATSLWGIYLVDVFDNMTLIHESEDCALLEPVAMVKTRRAQRIADRIDLHAEVAGVLGDEVAGAKSQRIQRRAAALARDGHANDQIALLGGSDARDVGAGPGYL